MGIYGNCNYNNYIIHLSINNIDILLFLDDEAFEMVGLFLSISSVKFEEVLKKNMYHEKQKKKTSYFFRIGISLVTYIICSIDCLL